MIKMSTIYSNRCANILSNMDARKDKVDGNIIASRIKSRHLFMYQPAHQFLVSLTLHCLNRLLCHR